VKKEDAIGTEFTVISVKDPPNDYSASANKNTNEYNDPNNWTGGTVGEDSYTYPTWLENAASNDKLYADTNGKQGCPTPNAEAELALMNLSPDDRQKMIEKILSKQRTYVNPMYVCPYVSECPFFHNCKKLWRFRSVENHTTDASMCLWRKHR
jgi:hypothetical protein